MNDSLTATLLAVALAAIGSWLWVRRRRVGQLVGHLVPPRTGLPLAASLAEQAPAGSRLDAWLFFLSLIVFAATRLIGIERFPIYFFSDEAANTVLAAELVRNGFRDASGRLLPLYFSNSGKLSLSASVYAQVIPYLLFGASVLVTRLSSAVIATSGTAAVGLTLKKVFRTRRAWVGMLLLAITPSWFLHSRTAFETTLFVSMFAWFLYFTLRYRMGVGRAVFPAVVFGALAFYSYSTGQPGVVLCGLLFVLVDARYLWQNRRTSLPAAVLAVALALPYVRFQAQHPGEIALRLQFTDSYLVRPDLSRGEKAARFVEEYAVGLSPVYWYVPENSRDLIRHRMRGYGNLLWPTLPFAAVGVVDCLRRRRDPARRALLIAALSAPAGAAMAGMHITRALVFIVPASLLTFLGIEPLLRWAGNWAGHARMSAAVFLLLTLVSGGMLRDALVNGPTWYDDYGLTGMQYGAPQVFGEIADYLEEHPQSQAWMFPTSWNGSDMLRRFFAPDDPRYLLLNLDSFLEERFDGVEQAVVVLTHDDLRRVAESGKFNPADVEATVPLPDGMIGFDLVRLSYSPQADALFAAERAARGRMVEEVVRLGGRTVTARHTPFDSGSLSDLFDGDPATGVRTDSINPAVLELDFGEPVRLTGLRLAVGATDMQVTIRVFSGEETTPGRYEATFSGRGPDARLDLVLEPPPGAVLRMIIEIRDLNGLASGRVHLREVLPLEE
jgi:hypothetical protein